MQILDKQDGLRKFAGPDHWNDPDMLEVGNGMPVNEERAHFTMWCMLSAPLIAGNDLRSMRIETLGVLSNRQAIAINQDSLGIQCFRHEVKDSVETWLKPLHNGRWALCFLNRSTSPKSISMDWQSFSVKDPLSGLEINTSGPSIWQLLDIWKPMPKKLMNTKKPLVATIPGHDVLCLKLFK
jgi:alpha-galactosidase